MRRSIKIAGGLALALAVVVVMGPDLLLIPFTLAFGWIKSLGRLSSVVHVSTGTIVWVVAAVALLMVGTHSFCCWVQRSRSATGQPWRWRWTCGFYAGLVLLLFASAGLVGVAHQTGWMISSPEPIFKNRRGEFREWMRLRHVGTKCCNSPGAMAGTWCG